MYDSSLAARHATQGLDRDGLREARQVLDARIEGGEYVVGRQGRDEGEHEVVPPVDEAFQRSVACTALEVLQGYAFVRHYRAASEAIPAVCYYDYYY